MNHVFTITITAITITITTTDITNTAITITNTFTTTTTYVSTYVPPLASSPSAAVWARALEPAPYVVRGALRLPARWAPSVRHGAPRADCAEVRAPTAPRPERRPPPLFHGKA